MLKLFQHTLIVLCLGALVSCRDDPGQLTYYVQLVRGSNDLQPPEPGSIVIGPKVAAQLRPVFAWTNYWEIARQEVSVPGGQKTRVRLNRQREVEVDLTVEGKRTVTTYLEGQAMTTVTRPIGQRMTIIGGERDSESSWFIIVRRDKPPE